MYFVLYFHEENYVFTQFLSYSGITGPHGADLPNQKYHKKMIPFGNPEGLGTSKSSKSKSDIEGHWSKIFKNLLSNACSNSMKAPSGGQFY